MRTHFLKQLQINGREKALALEPEFDFYRVKRVLKLELEFDDEPEALPVLRLDLAYEAGPSRYKLGVLFKEVRELVLPSMPPSLFLPELEIEDLRGRMMEGARFEMISHFERAFRCTCGDITILSFEPT
ncbi:hypothetical protein [Myxococcus fulvus]|uniref:hypothetical protein n=1 Tax=Myxococcus TaxID=32 RepID=UPI0020BEB6B5|nr:hypothetical protein [Myxococcus fulvus]MCK8503683.1 hypothetical protein [Myxococcus fulvus]